MRHHGARHLSWHISRSHQNASRSWLLSCDGEEILRNPLLHLHTSPTQKLQTKKNNNNKKNNRRMIYPLIWGCKNLKWETIIKRPTRLSCKSSATEVALPWWGEIGQREELGLVHCSSKLFPPLCHELEAMVKEWWTALVEFAPLFVAIDHNLQNLRCPKLGLLGHPDGA